MKKIIIKIIELTVLLFSTQLMAIDNNEYNKILSNSDKDTTKDKLELYPKAFILNVFKHGKLIPFEINKNSGIFTLYVSYKDKYFAKKSSDNTLQGEWDYVNHIYIDNNESGIFFQNIRLKRIIKDRDKYPKIKLELK